MFNNASHDLSELYKLHELDSLIQINLFHYPRLLGRRAAKSMDHI
mgnify:CR=1 FL=1|jgi:hypothetical protein